MDNEIWHNLVNAESEKGTWDFFHHSTSSIINLVKYNEEDSVEVSIWMDYYEFADLSKLIMRLNGK